MFELNETHEVDARTHQFYPKFRKLSEEQILYTEEMMSLNVNKKKLQHQLATETGKCVLLKNVSNISVAAKRKISGSRNECMRGQIT